MNYDFQSRLDRAFRQRIYMMNVEHKNNAEDNHNNPDNHDCTFDFLVMGASGKPYQVGMGEKSVMYCSCPDHTENHKLCKHLLFTLIRVLRIEKEDVYKSYFLKKSFICTPNTIMKCEQFIKSQQCKDLIGKYDHQGNVKQREIEEDDDCPICFEVLDNTKETVIYCKSTCGKSIHQSCFMKWGNWAHQKGPTCVYCKSEWVW